ncbi:MAG TPA: DUF6134 family protein [Chitinophagales bacterium]
MSLTKTLFIAAFFLAKISSAQTLKYDIVLFDKKIGETSVSKIEKGDGMTLYKLSSHSEAKFLFITKQSQMNADIWYKDGELYSSSFYVNNDEGEMTQKAMKIKDGYTLERNGVKQNLRRSIRHSSVQLYFSEPTILTALFSERLGEFFDLEKIAPSEYKSVIKNVSSFYRYANGRLVELEMSKPTGSAFLRLAN